MILKIGITGQNGFVGTHLYNTISLHKEEFELIPFDKDYFQNNSQLENWVNRCDVIVHLAAMNRHPDPQFIHDTNVGLVHQLVGAMENSSTTKHVIFSSSTQEERDNLYGKSKKAGRTALQQWAERNSTLVTGLIIPNVFGAYGKPFYNSVVATFCHQLCNGATPKIDVDGTVKLIYVQELVEEIIKSIRNKKNEAAYEVPHTSEYKVSELLLLLENYTAKYLNLGIIPELKNKFELNLFNTFRSYINLKEYYPHHYQQHSDDRGKFVELIRLEQGGQVSYSTTKPGITRGNHFHTRKIERFSVIKGKALIQLRKFNTDEVLNFELDGEQSSYVDMPIWFTHNIKNIGEDELLTVFWINEFYDANDPDTFFETV